MTMDKKMMEDIKPKEKSPDERLVQYTQNCINESKQAKLERLEKNKKNFDCYHLRQDFSHKIAGQSREVLPKQSMAVEQICTFIQQGLADLGDWFTVEKGAEVKDPLMSEEQVKKLVQLGLDKTQFLTFIGDSVKLGLLQSLMISKSTGEMCKKSVFFSEIKEVDGKSDYVLKKKDIPYWAPKLDLVRAEDYYPDPKSERGLYKIQEISMDISDVYKLTEGKRPMYSKAAVDQISAHMDDAQMTALNKSRETGQNVTWSDFRRSVKLWECWGTILDDQGKIVKENVCWTIANGTTVIQEPTDNPWWRGEDPFLAKPFIRVPHSVWHKALMDAPTANNVAINELYNLMVDDAANSVHGIKQIRPDWLMDESQVTNGIRAGTTLKVNNQAPAGAKVLERIDTNQMSSETLNMYHAMNSEFSASALTNDLRMGVLPNRAVKATEVVEASQSITSVFTGVSRIIEEGYIVPNLDALWKNQLQHLDQMYRKDLVDIWGAEYTDKILAIPKAVLFEKLVAGFTFKVYGVSRILQRQKDFKKYTALLQTIAADPVLAEEFQKEYSIGRFLGEILRACDVPVDRIKNTEEEKAQIEAGQAAMAQNAADVQSQIPQAGAAESADTVESMIPRSDFGGLQGKMNGGMGG